MSYLSQLALLKEMLESCESSLRSAKQLLNELSPGQSARTNYGKIAETLPDMTENFDGRSKVVEGIFDGQNMHGKDKNMYPVPSNYASKSKLVAGDVLKLTIADNGSFIYKQIGPVERKHIIGTLMFDNGKYKVLAGGKAYNVLTASVTYYKGEPGDQVSLIVSVPDESEWAAIDAVIPQHKVGEAASAAAMDFSGDALSFDEDNPENGESEETAEKPKKAKSTAKSRKKSAGDDFENLDV